MGGGVRGQNIMCLTRIEAVRIARKLPRSGLTPVFIEGARIVVPSSIKIPASGCTRATWQHPQLPASNLLLRFSNPLLVKSLSACAHSGGLHERPTQIHLSLPASPKPLA